jgi:hypothetical protein
MPLPKRLPAPGENAPVAAWPEHGRSGLGRPNHPRTDAQTERNSLALRAAPARACCRSRANTASGVAQTFLSAVSQVFQPAGRQNAGPIRRFAVAADRNVGDTADKNVCATLGNTPARRLLRGRSRISPGIRTTIHQSLRSPRKFSQRFNPSTIWLRPCCAGPLPPWRLGVDAGSYLRKNPAGPPPIRESIFWNLPIFFIICCIWANLLSIVFNCVTVTPLPLAMR